MWLVARSYRRPLRRSQHPAVRPPGENPAAHPQVARRLCPSAADRRLRDAGALARAVLCRRPAGQIASNPCEGIKTLYANDRSEIIWTDDDIAALRKVASAEVMWAVDLAAATGLRAADLFRLAWSHVGKDAIVITTSKSRFRREAVIPLYDELRALLQAHPQALDRHPDQQHQRPVDRLQQLLPACS
jgi:integrase